MDLTDNFLDPVERDPVAPTASSPVVTPRRATHEFTGAAYSALVLFMVVYCARPEDWIPGLTGMPVAKIAAILAVIALVFSLRHVRQRLPREVLLLGLLVAQFFLASAMSPVWREGALEGTLGFAKVLILAVVMAVTVTTPRRLRRLISVQAASVAVIAAVTVWKGHLIVGRLEGVLGGDYSNPNDLALAIVISLPLCLALLLLRNNPVWRAAWALAILVMTYTVILTGSRGGFLSLTVAATVCLWGFARGRRRYLLVVAAVLCFFVWQFSQGLLRNRLEATFGSKDDNMSAYDSAQQRKQLFWQSVEVTRAHPIFGVGPGNFEILSGHWHVTHNTFTEISSEAGLPGLALFLLILSSGFDNVRRTKRLLRSRTNSSLLARGLHASLAGYVAGALFTSTAYAFFPYVLVAYTTALLWMARHSPSKESESSRTSSELYGCGPEAEPAMFAVESNNSSVLSIQELPHESDMEFGNSN
jgi:O-antigen ligase